MEDQVLSIYQIVFDVFVLAAAGFTTKIIKVTNPVHKRGFFCGDDTLTKYTATKISIYNSKLFHPVVWSLCVFMIVLIERSQKLKPQKTVKLRRLRLPQWLHNAYNVVFSFTFCLLILIFVGTALKQSVGRLRPNFFADCAPNVNCTSPENLNVYHTRYECTNKNFSVNSRLSFPSGHTYFATYCAVFVAMHVQKRMSCRGCWKVAVESLAIFLSLLVAASRVGDYRHFVGDVLGGMVMGVVAAVIASAVLVKQHDVAIFKNKKEV